jgi:hypothetical protein
MLLARAGQWIDVHLHSAVLHACQEKAVGKETTPTLKPRPAALFDQRMYKDESLPEGHKVTTASRRCLNGILPA